MSNARDRSSARITRADLQRLSSLARVCFEEFFDRYERWRPYKKRLMLVCLCQGSALHYAAPRKVTPADREGGVNDFDVWGFFRNRPNERPFPPRWHGRQDFGQSKFGRNSKESPRFTGRRVDVLGRSIEGRRSEASIEAVQRYLREGRTESARRLAERPVAILWPDGLCGRIIWNPSS
jgi:hypothetical protein